MSAPIKPLMRFKIKPDPQGEDFYTVYICANKREMYRLWAQLKQDGKFDFEAQSLHQVVVSDQTGERLSGPDCGLVVFCTGSLSAGLVAHELAHLAVAWADESGWDFGLLPTELNEGFAVLMGNLTRQFWSKFNRLKARLRGAV